MIRTVRVVRAIVVAAIALLAPAAADAATKLAGQVFDNSGSNPLSNVHIEVEIGVKPAVELGTSDGNGKFSLDLGHWTAQELAAGQAQLTFRHPNYRGRTNVAFTPGQPSHARS